MENTNLVTPERPGHSEKRTIFVEGCGEFTVHVQGQLTSNKTAFLTVHDMGSNHAEFQKFVQHPSMVEVRERSVFLHLDLPGQSDQAPDLPDNYQYPTLGVLGNALIHVLDAFNMEYVIGLGEGAGANILIRFGMAHPQRCLGLILVHCTATSAGVMEYFRDKLINWKLANVGMNPTTEQYLVFHKFGRQLETAENKENVILEFQRQLQSRINPRNLRHYVEAFLNRTDLSDELANKLTIRVLLVTGSQASNLHTVHAMHSHLNKSKSELIQIDGVGDVLNEATDKVAQSLTLFVQGLGKLSSIPILGSAAMMSRTRIVSSGSSEGGIRMGRSMSMEDYDIPNPRRLSLIYKN